MPRLSLLILGCLLIWLGDATTASAQSGERWPDWIGTYDPQGFPRGPGYYLGITKIVASLVLFWLWTATTDWVNRDAQQLKLKYHFWNGLLFGTFAVAFLLLWVTPWFLVSYSLLIAAYCAPFGYYVMQRNKPLSDAEKVFTPDHFKFLLAQKLKFAGVKPPKPKPKSPALAMALLPRNVPTPAEEQVRLIAARQSAGYGAACSLIGRALDTRASAAMVDYTPESASVRYLIDGVWLDVEKQPRQVADPMLVTLKNLCGLKADDRRSRQQGVFIAFIEDKKLRYPAKFTSQGTKTGERALIQFEDPSVRKRRLPDLGLRQKVQDDLQALMNEKNGLVVIAALPGGGLTTLTTACLAAVDRYTRSVIAVEEKQAKDIEVENVQVLVYDVLEQETAKEKIVQLVRQFPEVMVIPDYVDAEVLGMMCDESEERLVVTTTRAKDAAEALIRPLTTKISPKKYAKVVKGAVAQRVIRKLCDACKEAYPPPPQILQRLGLPADKVPAFYRPPTQPRETICPECRGLAYKGQTALYELLIVGDAVRQQLVKEPTVEAVRLAARKAGMKTMEDEGLLLIVKGVTSVAELQRVLKEGAV